LNFQERPVGLALERDRGSQGLTKGCGAKGRRRRRRRRRYPSLDILKI